MGSVYQVITKDGQKKILAYGKEFPYTNPLNIELYLYRINYHGEGWKHMRNAAFLLWPEKKYTWHKWSERRFQAHCAGYNTITLAGGASTGKAVTLNTKIKTPYGWVRMRNIKEGDIISDPHGGTQQVTAVHPIKELPYYKITFNDGSSIQCCEDHLWNIQTQHNRATNKYQIVNTKTLFDLIIHYGKNKLSIPRTKAIWQPEQTLPLDPYILGLFIGDGYISKYEDRMNIGLAKSPIKDFLLSKGCTATWRKQDNTWSIPIKQYKQSLINLGYLNIKSNKKFIPKQYLQGSIKQRAALLAGLLDTDGYLAVDCLYEYTTKSTRLAIQIVHLARSLGYKVTLRKKLSTRYDKSYGMINRILISDCSNGEPLPTLRLHPRQPKTRAYQLITSIEPIGIKKGRCITVSNQDGLYVTKDYIVTHNSHDAAMIALLFWLANPTQRIVLVASTSLSDLQNRIWGYIQKFYTMEHNKDIILPGKLYSSNNAPKILCNKQDPIHGVFAVPLKPGKDSKPSANLIGRHAKEGFMAIIDEGTDVNPGFMDARANWESGVTTYQLMVIGNSNSKFDPHGLLSKPKGGWHTVNPDFDSEWETKNGICLYFDCYASPALPDNGESPEKIKRIRKFLFNEDTIEAKKIQYGENTPSFWRYVRGFWPKDDVSNTVLTVTMCDKFKVEERVAWEGVGKIIRVAGLDPSFTGSGDDCVFRWAEFGISDTGVETVDFGGKERIIYIKIDDTSSEPAEYQILRQVKKLCGELGIEPRNLAVDTWGAGSGLGSILREEWSTQIHQVVSSGAPTDLLVANGREEIASQVYDRRVTELWFSVRELVLGGQIKGLDTISEEQFCTRTYESLRGKYKLEAKPEYKMRLGKVDNHYKSPDEADAVAFIIDLLRQRYGLKAVVGEENKKTKEQRVLEELQKEFDFERKLQTGQRVTTEREVIIHPQGHNVNYKDIYSDFKESDLW